MELSDTSDNTDGNNSPTLIQNNQNDQNNNEVKHVIIQSPEKYNCIVKKIKTDKEKKYRLETYTWGLTEEELSHSYQLNTIYTLIQPNNITPITKYHKMFISHIKSKISCYKQQDKTKKKIDINSFVDYVTVLKLLEQCELKCHYCDCHIFVFYNLVRESKQWTLDRIDNNIGHNKNNLVVACLECNLKRRRINKNAFMFTKNMTIIKRA